MPDLATLLLFLTAATVLVVTPGPAVIYIVTRSVTQGRAAGLASVAGVALGNLLQVVAATAGLAALVASSTTAFQILRLLGAGYLIYLGGRRLLTATSALAAAGTTAAGAGDSPARLFRDGALVAALNPKTALFFLAFLPQFTRPERGPVELQVLGFGLMTVALGALSDSTYALLAGQLGSWLRRTRRFAQGERIASGLTYLTLGFLTLLGGPPRRG